MALKIEELDAASLTKAMKGARSSAAKGEAALAYLAKLDAERPSRRGRSDGGGTAVKREIVEVNGKTLVKRRDGSAEAWHEEQVVWVRSRKGEVMGYFADEAAARKGGRKSDEVGTLAVADVLKRLRRAYEHCRKLGHSVGKDAGEYVSDWSDFKAQESEYVSICKVLGISRGGY